MALSRVCRRNPNRVSVASAAAKPPSMKPSATELESLEEMSTVVPDTLILEEVSEVEKPKAATVSPGVLAGILSSPSGLRPYKVVEDHHDSMLNFEMCAVGTCAQWCSRDQVEGSLGFVLPGGREESDHAMFLWTERCGECENVLKGSSGSVEQGSCKCRGAVC